MDSGPSQRFKAVHKPDLLRQEEEEDQEEGGALFGVSQEEIDLQNSRDKDGLYSLLNVSKTASTETIASRYKVLAVSFHPDKQRNPERKKAAESRFQAIQRAYEILTDTQQRAVYDLFGEEGLKTSWEVGSKLKTPEEMREEFTRQSRAKKSATLERLIKSKGDINLNIDARALTVPAEQWPAGPPSLSLRAKNVKSSQLMMRHSFETPINSKTTVNLAGQMLSRNGAGGGNLFGTLKHQFSPQLSLDLGLAALPPRVFTSKTLWTINDQTFLTLNTASQSIYVPPTFNITLGRQLYSNTTGYVTFRSGFYTLGLWGAQETNRRDASSMTVGFTTQKGNENWTVETAVGLLGSSITADWGRKVLGGVEVKVGGSVQSSGNATVFLTGETRITENTKLGLGVEAALSGGVTVKVKLNRLGQRISVPVLLTSEYAPEIFLVSAVVPTVTYIAAHYLYLEPSRKRRIKRRLAELRTENAEWIQQKKTEAEEAVRLLEQQVDRKIQDERSKGGLIIISAYYGNLTSFTARGLSGLDSDFIDVTLPVQSLVVNSQLVIPGGRPKSGLLGFYDPCMGVKKKLRIRYEFKGRVHEITVDDVSGLIAPQRGHSID